MDLLCAQKRLTFSSMSVGSIMYSPEGSVYCFGPSHSRSFHSLFINVVKYELSNFNGLGVHGPSNPDLEAAQQTKRIYQISSEDLQ